MADSVVVDSALVDAALYKIDVPASSYIYAAYGKSSLKRLLYGAVWYVSTP
jgi:hypothetical protein